LEIQDRMTQCAAQVRVPDLVSSASADAWQMVEQLNAKLRITGIQSLPMAFRVADLCLTHAAYLEAIRIYLSAGGGSRGGVMVLDANGEPCGAGLDSFWSFRKEDPTSDAALKILEVSLEKGSLRSSWVDVRPIPECDGWFERVWSEFRSSRVFSSSEEE
jgi:hypothetical protein